MLSIIASPIGFATVILLFGIGALGSLFAGKRDKMANGWNGLFAILGSLGGILFSGSLLLSGQVVVFGAAWSSFPLISLAFNIDQLAAFFLFTISLISLFCSIYGVGYLKHFYGKYSIGAFGFFYQIFILGMLLVVTASNALFFLFVWEIMSIASYLLVVYDRRDANNIRAGFLYLVMTHFGTAFIVAAFLLLYRFTGSFDFAAIQSAAGAIPLSVKNAVFVLSMIGFGTKAGIIPFHIWLPSAHPAAPSHVSGLMSGVMIKTGIFMMIRLFLDLLQPVPEWWGLVVIVIGSVSALLGVLYALTEHDLKRLLAYHSIENIGIILLGVGSALTFSSLGMMSLAILGLVGALFHTLNHATFKSLLFLSAGSVIAETHTRNMEEYGGLAKRMPQTAGFFLIGSMAIVALPPFNGFMSEWVTLQSLFQGMIHLSATGRSIFIVAAGALALTGGLALACFVKAFASTFLARPRSDEASHAKESASSLRIGMGGLGALCLLFGL
ncbi:MAG: proton-conducting transporter membrane subunit, partial [Patescibacteria group bacterium]